MFQEDSRQTGLLSWGWGDNSGEEPRCEIFNTSKNAIPLIHSSLTRALHLQPMPSIPLSNIWTVFSLSVTSVI